MRSASADFKKLPRDDSSKSLVASIEDVAKSLEANDDLEMEYDLSNIDNLIKEILKRIAANKSLESKIIMNKYELEEINVEPMLNHLNDSSEAELGEIYNEIKTEEAPSNPDILTDREMKFIQETIKRIKQIEEKTGIKSTDTYYFNGKKIFPELNDSNNELNAENKLAEFETDNKKVRFEDENSESLPKTKKLNSKKSLDSIKFKLDDSDDVPNYDKFVRVDETDSYVEFAKEANESYDPKKFSQVEWDDELMELNSDIYKSIKKKKVCLQRRESSNKATEKKQQSGLPDIEETLHDIKFDPPKKPAPKIDQPKLVVKQKQGAFGRIKSIFKKKNKVSPPQENTKEIFVDAKYKKKFRMENIKKKLRK